MFGTTGGTLKTGVDEVIVAVVELITNEVGVTVGVEVATKGNVNDGTAVTPQYSPI